MAFRLVLVFLPVLFVGFDIWSGFFRARCPLGICSFVSVPFLVFVFSLVLFLIVLGPFYVRGFSFNSRILFCFVMFCSFGSGNPYLFCRFGNRFSSVAYVRFFGSGCQLFKVFFCFLFLRSVDRFGSRNQLLKRSVINGPGPFFGSGSQFYKNIVTVRDRFGSGSQFLKMIVINGLEPFGSGSQFLEKFVIYGLGPFWVPGARF